MASGIWIQNPPRRGCRTLLAVEILKKIDEALRGAARGAEEIEPIAGANEQQAATVNELQTLVQNR